MSRRDAAPTGLAILLLLSLALWAEGCSSLKPVRTGRAGFLERLGKLETPGGRSRSLRDRMRDDDDQDLAERDHSEDIVDSRTIALLRTKARSWSWPLREVVVTSAFGERGREFHEGVDLRASSGTPVLAAAAGRVLYAGSRVSGYGRMVVLRHEGKVSTVYAHTSRLLVRVGQQVRRGQRIAFSGASGKASAPHLHFEIRSGVAAVNPEKVLASADSRSRARNRAIASR